MKYCIIIGSSSQSENESEEFYMKHIEKTLNSIEVSGMVEKEHSKLLKDIRRYEEQFNEAKIGSVDFFRKSAYQDKKGEMRPCYKITKKGCEFIAHKLTGTKGTIFTARYINRFHEMEDIISNQKPELKLPWFIKKLRQEKIMLFRDFESIAGVKLLGKYTAYGKQNGLVGGRDYNGWGWKCQNEEFRAEYGFDYGEEPCMHYLYVDSIKKQFG